MLICASSGCRLLLPEASHEPIIRNPFPQLGRVAIAPFFNHSDESTVDGRQFALAYFGELQSTPGFEVVPLGVVEEAMIAHRIDLSGPGEARRLAELLGVDAVVVGSVTDYSPYYPPRIGLRVEWYAANPGFHEIPAGYGLAWDTPEEEFIPDSLVYESQLAQARVQMASQSPDCSGICQALPPPPMHLLDDASNEPTLRKQEAPDPGQSADAPFTPSDVQLAQHAEELPPSEPTLAPNTEAPAGEDALPGERIAPFDSSSTATTTDASVNTEPSRLPSSLPTDAAGRPACIVRHGPVLSHTRIYDGLNHDVTQALQGYAYFRDDERIGGWQSYLRRSDDFVRFCCHLHIAEMLSARGGAHKTRVVLRWPDGR